MMSRDEMELFLADLHVAIISIPLMDRGPLTVPLWYTYEPGGELRVMTFKDSWKAKLLLKGVRISLCVQDEGSGQRSVPR